jgi:hypothetical protein
MVLTINTNTIANAGPDQNVCGNSTVFLIANTVSGGNWTGGTGTFNPTEIQQMQLIHLLFQNMEQRYIDVEFA